MTPLTPIGPDTKQAVPLSTLTKVGLAVAAAINIPLYFPAAFAGGKHTPLLQNSTPAIYAISAWASLDYGFIMYMVYRGITLKPRMDKSWEAVLSWALILPGLVATLGMLAATKAGVLELGLSLEVAWGIGISMAAIRSLNLIDSAVKFPDKLKEIKHSWGEAWHSRDIPEIARIGITLYAAIGFSACTTDSIYSASLSTTGSNIAALTLAPIGAIGLIALVLYWTHRGLKQLSFGGKTTELGITDDPTDRYTLLAFIIAAPMFLAALAAATAAPGPLFGQLGDAAKWIAITSSFIYAVCSVIPGLAYSFRNVGYLHCEPKAEISEEREKLISDKTHYGSVARVTQLSPLRSINRRSSLSPIPV